jgi:two-component system response regulator PilR (NtrC family)
MKKILIVDDEELICWGLSRIIHNLTTFDSDIKAVNNAGEAAAEIDSCKYDLCFLDIHLPDGDGLDLMRRAKESSPKTKVVMMTSYELDDSTRNDIQENAFSFVPKPFDLIQLREVVESALAGEHLPLPLTQATSILNQIETNETGIA